MKPSMEEALKVTFLDVIEISGTVLERVLKYDGDTVTGLTNRQLSADIFDLAKYQVTLQLHSNVRSANVQIAKRAYYAELRRTLNNLPPEIKSSKLTVKEKEARAVELNPKIAELEQELEEAEVQEVLFRKVPEQTIELINSLKKELSRRAAGGQP